jgi:hypothetical protein
MSICSTHHRRSEDGVRGCKHVLPGVGCMERAELCVPVTIRMRPLEGPTRGRKDLRSYLLLLAVERMLEPPRLPLD